MSESKSEGESQEDGEEWEESEEEETPKIPVIVKPKIPSIKSPDGLFTFHSADYVQSRIDAKVQSMQDIFSYLSIDQCFLLLLKFDWKDDKIQNPLFGDNSEEFLRNSGLVLINPKTAKQLPVEDRLCEGCCMMKKKDEFVIFPCGDISFCRECVSEGVNSIIETGSDQRKMLFECMDRECMIKKHPVLLYPSLVKSLLSPENLIIYEKGIRNDYFKSTGGKMRGCSNCDKIAERNDVYLDCECPCGKEFCIACGDRAHSPATCGHLRNWVLLTQAGQATADWLALNTRQCPVCRFGGNLADQHADGCNHITCGKGITPACGCGYQYCYVCLAKWEGVHLKSSPYVCPTPPPVTETADIRSRQDYNQHYFTNVDAEEAKIRRAANTLATKGDDLVQAYMEMTGFTIQQCQFIKNVYKNLIICRKILRDSLIYGHGMGPKHPQKLFFEFIQENLREVTDQLDVKLINFEKDAKSALHEDLMHQATTVLKSALSLNKMIITQAFIKA